MHKSVLLALPALAGLALAYQSPAATIFQDALNAPNGTALNGHAADVGGAWNVSVDSTTSPLVINNNAVTTVGARRVATVAFTRAITSGETLTMTYSESLQSFNTGFAGFRFLAGGAEKAFVGDTNDDAGTGFDIAVGSAGGTVGSTEFQSGNKTLPANLAFTYAYDTGAASLSLNGSPVVSGTLPAHLALDSIQEENNGGGDVAFGPITVTATTPEPASAGLLGLGALGLLARRRRRTA